jgi:hypothetical protein
VSLMLSRSSAHRVIGLSDPMYIDATNRYVVSEEQILGRELCGECTAMTFMQAEQIHFQTREICSRSKMWYSKYSIHDEKSVYPKYKKGPNGQNAVQLYNRNISFVYSETQTAAIPIPVPTHMLVTPIFLFVRLSSVSSVLTWREPVQPRG